jgi:chemotaxis protein methyltransferase CheR
MKLPQLWKHRILTDQLTKEEFEILRTFLIENYGITLKDEKKVMLEARLKKRLMALGFETFKQYISFLFSHDGLKIELPRFLDVVTTHKTEFFRNREHFKILEKKVLPELINNGVNKIDIWSAGCSTGEECYTIAMVVQNFIDTNKLNVDYHILGSDISEEVIEIAKRGIYSEDKVEPVPMVYKKKFLLRSKDRKKKLVKIVPELREKVNFRFQNIIEDCNFRSKFHIIFCRNVAIYFKTDIQKQLFKNLINWLHTGGYLFIGASESLFGFELPVIRISPTVYRKIKQ